MELKTIGVIEGDAHLGTLRNRLPEEGAGILQVLSVNNSARGQRQTTADGLFVGGMDVQGSPTSRLTTMAVFTRLNARR